MVMTVQELIAALQGFTPSAEVWVRLDGISGYSEGSEAEVVGIKPLSITTDKTGKPVVMLCRECA